MTGETFESFQKKLENIFDLNNIAHLLSQDATQKFYQLSTLLIKVNSETNLTAINDIDDIILKHYADSLLAVSQYEKDASVIDVGCGAGFPSLPLAIVRPDLKITALDSTGKKIDFVKLASRELGLKNVTAVSARAEEFVDIAGKRESFTHATARAVSRLNVLSELTLPFVKVGGSFIALKSKDGDTELSEAITGIATLGGEVKTTEHLNLVSYDGFEAQRTIIVIEKKSSTPKKYPRTYSKISKKPL